MAALLAAACALPGTAQAQERKIDISASNRIQYDSDAVLGDRRISGGGGGDVSTAPTLNLDIYLPRATGSLYLRGGIGYTFYRKFRSLNREAINLDGGFDQSVLGACVVHGGAHYSRTLSGIGDIPIGVVNGGAFRNSIEQRTVSADIGCGGEIGLRPSVAVSRSETRNTAEIRKTSDVDTNNLTGQIGYASPALGVISVFGRYSDSKYINRPTATGQEDGVRTYSAGVQVERTVGTRLSFSASGNYTRVQPYIAAVQGFSGVGYALSASYSGDFFQVSIDGSRNAEPSSVLFVSYDIQTSLGLSLTTEIAQSLRWSGGINWRRRSLKSDPRFSPIFELFPLQGDEDTYNLNAGLSYQMSKRLRFSIDGSYSKRTSNTRLFSYDQKRFSFTTSLSL